MFGKIFSKGLTTSLIAGLAAVLVAVPVMAATPAATPATSPETAMAPQEEAVTISEGEEQWYAFKYEYHDADDDEDQEDPKEATVEMNVLSGDVEFIIMTADRLGPWDDEDDDPGPVGACAPTYRYNNENGDGVYNDSVLTWTGSAQTTDVFYVIVEGEGEYELSIDGETVSFTESQLQNRDAYGM